MSTTCTRMAWPVTSGAWGTPHTVNGRTYVSGPGVFDAMNQDVAGLVTAGAVALMQSGAVPNTLLGSEGLPAAGVALSGVHGPPQGSNIASVPDVAADPSRPVPVTIPTTATTATATAVLTFGGGVPAGVVPGMTAKDTTTPAALTTQTVLSVAPTAVTLSAAVSAAVGNGDSITFTPAVGTLYMDVAINQAIFWDGSLWRDVWSGLNV